MDSILKEVLLKRKSKLKPKEEGMSLMSEEEMMPEDSAMEEGEGSKKPLTIKVEAEAEGDEELKDLAPGKPSEPEDVREDGEMSKDNAHELLMDAILGGLSKEEIMSKKGKMSLMDRVRQGAMKMKA